MVGARPLRGTAALRVAAALPCCADVAVTAVGVAVAVAVTSGELIIMGTNRLGCCCWCCNAETGKKTGAVQAEGVNVVVAVCCAGSVPWAPPGMRRVMYTVCVPGGSTAVVGSCVWGCWRRFVGRWESFLSIPKSRQQNSTAMECA